MKKNVIGISLSIAIVFGLNACDWRKTGNLKESEFVDRQQEIYAKTQPIPAFDYSLPRQLLIELYKYKNQAINTTSIFYSYTGKVIDYCPSIGYGIPVTSSLTNPTTIDKKYFGAGNIADGVIGQADPDGTFVASTSTASWVFCTNKDGSLSPRSIESLVHTYPGNYTVDMETGKITQIGENSVKIRLKK